jgi:hypothetical protein
VATLGPSERVLIFQSLAATLAIDLLPLQHGVELATQILPRDIAPGTDEDEHPMNKTLKHLR